MYNNHIKVLHINTTDRGGAAAAAIRLHLGLLKYGVSTKFLFKFPPRKFGECYQFKLTLRAHKQLLTKIFKKLGLESWLRSRLEVKFSKLADQYGRLRQQRPVAIQYLSFPLADSDITQSTLYSEADIIHLHWVTDFLDYPSFFRKNTKPVVWTLHDMEPFQGGIHYRENFYGIDNAGFPVPYSIPASYKEIIMENFAIKKEALNHVKDLTIAAPSQWLYRQSKESQLLGRFNHAHIPYGLDRTVFTERNRLAAREKWEIAPDNPCILFVADKVELFRKGFIFLQRALEELQHSDITLLTIGQSDLSLSKCTLRQVGRVEKADEMSELYSAADVFIIPSVEDNLPNTVMESMACGTPVIGFPVGGIVDMIIDGVNGYLCTEVSVPALQIQLQRFLENPTHFDRRVVRESSAKYDELVQAKRYCELYRNLVAEPK